MFPLLRHIAFLKLLLQVCESRNIIVNVRATIKYLLQWKKEFSETINSFR